MSVQWPILIVDDEEVVRESMTAWLCEDGHRVDSASDGHQAIDLAQRTDYALCFVDLKMPGGLNGIDTLKELKRLRPETTVVIMTAYATVDTAVQALKDGAQEYLVKPCNPRDISVLVARVLDVKRLQRENALLRKKLTRQYRHHDIITKDQRMQELLDLARDVASLRTTVLVRGESGTGKELVARAIHYSGDRAQRPFVTISCAALTETLLESELFGYEKGAFTGANAQTAGKFERADGGTIFLDEIGDISPKLQADLLRVLQERSFYRVGGNEEVQVDARVIAATNRDLHEAVRAGRFRHDLYYRLNVIELNLPPLRERRTDIPLLAQHFVERISVEMSKPVPGIREDALELLIDYDWPGNVRELENAIERAMVICRTGTLTRTEFAAIERAARTPQAWVIPEMTLAELEKQAVIATLERKSGNVKEAAAALGIDRSTLYDHIKRYEIERTKK